MYKRYKPGARVLGYAFQKSLNIPRVSICTVYEHWKPLGDLYKVKKFGVLCLYLNTVLALEVANFTKPFNSFQSMSNLSILLWLTPDNFTHQGDMSGTAMRE